MSKLTGALGALQGLEKGMVGRDQAKAQLAQTLFDLRKYQEITLPTAQAQIETSKAATELTREQIAGMPQEREYQRKLGEELDVRIASGKEALDDLLETKKLYVKYGIKGKEVSLLDEELANKLRDQQSLTRQKLAYAKEGGPEAVGTAEAFEAKGKQRYAAAALTEGLPEARAETERIALEAQAKQAPLSTDVMSAQLKEISQRTDFNALQYPKLLDQMDWQIKLMEAQVRALPAEATERVKRLELIGAQIRQIDASIQAQEQELTDKAKLDELVRNARIEHPFAPGIYFQTWDEYKLTANSMIQTLMQGTAGAAKMPGGEESRIKAMVFTTDTLWRQVKKPSSLMVTDFIDNLSMIIGTGGNPYYWWEAVNDYYPINPGDIGTDHYPEQDKIITPEKAEQVMGAIQKALSQQARTSAAGGTSPAPGTTPKVYGPPTPSGVREQVAGGSVIDTTFGLDAATRQKIAGIIEMYRNDPSLQQRIVDEAIKEKDPQKQNAIGNFADWYYNK